MKITLSSISLVLACKLYSGFHCLQAQETINKVFWRAGADASLAQGQRALNIYSERIWGLTKSKNLLLGFGFRLTAHQSSEILYRTAPASLVKGARGPQILFLDENPEQIDTLRLPKSTLLAGNFSFMIGYKVSPKFEVGFNIDLVGITVGATQKAKFESTEDPTFSGRNFNAEPTLFNALLVAENDRGTLQSQFYFSYLFTKRSAVKAGISYLFTEYTTSQKLSNNNDRFRNTTTMIMIGYNYIFP